MRPPREFDTRCERVARAVATRSTLFAPGLTIDDLIQEARVGVWQSLRDYNPASGHAWVSFAWTCAHRRLLDAVATATRAKHHALNHAIDMHATVAGTDRATLADILPAHHSEPDRVVAARDELRALTAAMRRLTDTERDAILRCAINGEPYHDDKRTDNAMQRGRRKLRAAMAEAA